MELFSINEQTNLLPQDGIVHYYGTVLSRAVADVYLDKLLHQIQWQHDEAFIFGRHIITKRKVAWYADQDYSYTYSNRTKHALPWTPELRQLKTLAEQHTRETYNSCLLNLYHDGNEGMAWHSDDEKTLAPHSAIASLSFGAERKFSLKHRSNRTRVTLQLAHGSLLVMKGTTQQYWLHSLPKSTKILLPRVNLTFRTMAV